MISFFTRIELRQFLLLVATVAFATNSLSRDCGSEKSQCEASCWSFDLQAQMGGPLANVQRQLAQQCKSDCGNKLNQCQRDVQQQQIAEQQQRQQNAELQRMQQIAENKRRQEVPMMERKQGIEEINGIIAQAMQTAK